MTSWSVATYPYNTLGMGKDSERETVVVNAVYLVHILISCVYDMMRGSVL